MSQQQFENPREFEVNKELRFVDWFSVGTILDHVCTGGVKSAILIKRDGVVISIGGQTLDANITSALLMSIFDHFSSFCTSNSPLGYLTIDCENGQIAIVPLGQLYLCLIAEKFVQSGMLQMKVRRSGDERGNP